jgi:hypothetical protein
LWTTRDRALRAVGLQSQRSRQCGRVKTRSAPGLFESVCNLAVDLNDANRLYAADFNNHRVQEFNPNGGFLDAWGSFGTDPGQFEGVSAIAVDNMGFLYVLDFANNRLQKFLRSDLVSADAGSRTLAPLVVRPNPSSAETRFTLQLSRPRSVELSVMDVGGRLVRRLVHGATPSASMTAIWDLRDESGVRVKPGVFLARLVAGEDSRTTRVFVLQ